MKEYFTLKIWKYPTTTYEPISANEKLFTLADDDKDFTNEKIISFKMMKDSYKAANWKDFYEKVAYILYDLDCAKFNNIIDNNKSRQEEKLRDSIKISDNIYLETNLNTEAKLIYCAS